MYFADGLNTRNTDIIRWWKCNTAKFPLLSLAAKKFLAEPATQTTSERLFSLSGNIITPTQAKLLLKNVEQLSFLYYHLK